MEPVTVSMPTWRTPPDLLVRAVESVLGQTHRDLLLVVVGDGEPVPTLPEDPRLVVVSLPENRGRYYVDAVVARACRTRWFTTHDADDYSHPARIERLLAAGRSVEVVAGGETVHRSDGRIRLRPPQTRANPRVMRHLWHLSALYRTDVVDGLLHPGFRIGYDTLLSNLLAWSSTVAADRDPLYHRCARDGSLTRSAETGMRSAARRAVVERLLDLHRRAAAVASRRSDVATRYREMVADDAGPELLARVDEDADRVRALLPAVKRPTVDASDVVVTFLTGGRPGLAAETLRSIRQTAPGLLDSAHVVALNNGSDDPTRHVLLDNRDVLDDVQTSDEMLPIGPAISRLADAAKRSGRTHWLHLEDDWEALDDPGWLDQAREILRRPQVSQVRLRAASERVLPRHMVTSAPISWVDRPGCRVAADAHLTFNPSLVRVAQIDDGWPCSSEPDAQRRWHAAGRRVVAQLVPGVFVHLGDGDSLRTRPDRRKANA